MTDAPKRGLIAPGMYHFVHMAADAGTRFHLRVDLDGGGMLLANAAASADLSPTGVYMAEGVLQGRSDGEIIGGAIAAFKGASPAQIAADLARVRELMTRLTTAGPPQRLGGMSHAESRRLAAPYQATVVQGDGESTEAVLRQLWDIGVPQATLLAQPDQDPAGLVRLVECAQDIGMICGIRGIASRLGEVVIRDAAMAGL